jgi:signal transduction histidine kinase
MQKSNLYRFAKGKLFGGHLEFRVRLFNALALAGVLGPFVAGLAFFLTQADARILLIDWAAAAAAFGIMAYAARTQKYVRCYYVTIFTVFLFLFPYIFFTTGGYSGGMAFFFVFAIVFTAFMLERKPAYLMLALELAVYTGCYVTAFLRPEAVSGVPDGRGHFLHNLVDFIIVAVSLAGIALAHFGLYNRQQKQLEDANKRLSELDRMKTEFLQDMRHEMQNPLTTIARGIEFAENLIGRPDKSDMARDALKLAQEEALRVGRMVEGMINLSTMSGGTEKREKVDFESLLVSCAEAFRLQLAGRETSLYMEVDPGLPYVFGVADQLKQVLFNLFQNTARHTRNGAVMLTASGDGTVITVRVSDTGEGIPQELLAHVFERGFSGKESSGYGLAICRTIVEAHGGRIQIESGQDRGTAVTFTIPVYGGQSETRGKNE